LLPAPYFNLVRYHGSFANRSRFRPLLPPPPAAGRAESTQALPTPAPEPTPPGLRPRRLGWAQLLRRVLEIDALTCAKCAVPMTVIAFLSDPKVVERILDHLKLPSSQPLLAESRLATAEELFNDAPAYDEIGVEPLAWSEPLDTGPPDARDPP